MDKDQIKKTITDTFLNRFDEISPQIQAHFMTRLYRVTGEEVYKSWVINNIPLKLKRLEGLIEISHNFEEILKYSNEELSKFKILKPNDVKKSELMHQYPQVYFYDDLLAALAYLKGVGVNIEEYGIEKLRPQIKEYLPVLLNPEILRYVTVRDINAIYWIKDIFGINESAKLIENFLQIFKNTDSKEISFTNFIYGYTHIIISSSLYYQQFVENSTIDWIKDELILNMDKILASCTPDIIAEVGLCLKLMKYYDVEIFEKITNKIISSFDMSLGLIPYENQTKSLGTLEHRNIIAVMFLTDFNKLSIF